MQHAFISRPFINKTFKPPIHRQKPTTATSFPKPLHLLEQPQYPSKLTKFSIPSLLKYHAAQLNLPHGKRLHCTILQMGLQSDPFIASSLITLYFKCHSPTDATNVFAELPQRDVTLWNAMLAGNFRCGRPDQALSFIQKMQLCGTRPDGHSLTIMLKSCSDKQLDLNHGKQAHAYVVKNDLDLDLILVTALIDMYLKFGNVMEASRVFDRSTHYSVSMWNAMIAGLCFNGLWEKSLEHFVLMRSEGFEVESTAISSVLVACSMGESVGFSEGVHCCVVKLGFELDPYVSTSLVAMYGKFGLADAACRVFYGVPDKGIELWNSMVSTCVTNSCPDEALDIYNQMRSCGVQSDSVTISNVLSACTVLGHWDFGRSIHGELTKRLELNSMVVQSSLITMYLKSADIEDAVKLFNSSKDMDVILWGSMISGLCQNKRFEQALALFNQLRAIGLPLDSAIIASGASACTGLKCLQLGCQIHGHAIKSGMSSDHFVGSALIDMYSKLGLPQLASSVFFSMPYKNLVVWNSMIAGFGRNGLLDQSITTFIEIYKHGLVPDSISTTSILASVSSSAGLVKGKMIHGYQIRNGIVCDILVENALLDMYMKCGCLNYSQSIFEMMPTRNVVSWNTMIAGYGYHGHCAMAIGMFEQMITLNALPDDTTFLALLSSCSHSGLVEEGRKLFESMTTDYGIVPRMEHYANMVDILARAGLLDEAYCFIQSMPVEPDEGVWLCLLSACRAYRALRLGEIAADQLLRLKPGEGGSYTQVLNFYGEMGLLDEAARLRAELREVGMKKSPGCSWIEVKDGVEVFRSGDSASPLTVEVHAVLGDLRRNMREGDEFS